MQAKCEANYTADYDGLQLTLDGHYFYRGDYL